MTGAASSAIPLPADRVPAQQPTEDRPALTFSPSTRFPAAPGADSDEAASDPDDQVPSQLDSAREQLRRDRARDAIRKEQVHMEGFLSKKAGGASKAWNKRWCVLRSQALLIYKRYSEEKLKRIIRADEIVDVRPASHRHREFAFEVETPERSFCFEASSDHELESWVARLRAVVAAVNTAADAAPRCSTDSRHTAGAGAGATVASAFRSLPAAPRRARDATTPVQAIFTNSPDIDADAADGGPAGPATAPAQMPSALGLRIELERPLGAVQFAAAATATALPPGIGPDHEPVPVADGDDGGEDDDEPNFNEDQRREIENRLEEDRVVLRGYLLKQDKLRQWRRRWFVLRQNTLSYYHDDREYEVKQILRRHDVYDIRAPDPSTAKAKSLSRTYFKVVAAKRNYWLAHDDAAVAREWFTALLQWNESETAYPRALVASSTLPAGAHSLPAPPTIIAHRIFSAATSPAAALEHPPPH
ncbi:hypothetical protein LPJ61_002044 [Coemansia biformis]|uniref:PH domain-containing protein n=1 Tax=Coemansia biformis TaxID=1286918 RepID=A0A9W7Y907_9FUNG|nr:hypothetical protein LPJ61_002044 [Coemansia biformis]